MTTQTITVDSLQSYIQLGRRGENLARSIRFDFAPWAEAYGAGVAQLLIQRKGDTEPYAVSTTTVGTDLIWPVTATDTDKVGTGQCELLYYVGDLLAKSQIYRTTVEPSLDAEADEPPEPWQSWVDDVLAAGADAQAGADAAAEWASEAAGSAAAANADAIAASGSADAAAGSATSATSSAASAALDAEAARNAANSMSFVSFVTDANGHLILQRSERLGTTAFSLNDYGHLEVTI